ncbi:MAG: cytochrome ubiquinol oxidase subunit I, partial [Patescibacteria group bacterium]
MDQVLLARIQFALTIGFHFIFPPLTIGLAWMLVIFEAIGWKKNDEVYAIIGKFFGKILGLIFAVGVATGIVMEFQFGTNWAEYSKFVGDIFGAPLAAEGVFAFFLESTFLGLYIFGREKVSKGVHWFSILMVAVGSTISGFWILVANSWQQTPAGFVVQNGRAELTDFWAAVFNPSTLPRFYHTIDASLISGAFFVAGVSAYFLLKGKHLEFAK